jgi:threonine/homoserine/homoserine lactone efflux protein
MRFSRPPARCSARLPPADPSRRCGYLVAIAALRLASGPFINAAPMLATAVRICLAGYSACLAWRLWRVGVPAGDVAPAMFGRNLFLTTLLNPKAFAVALAIFPPSGTVDFGLRAAVFALISVVAAAGWIAIGASPTAIRSRAPASSLAGSRFCSRFSPACRFHAHDLSLRDFLSTKRG